MEEETVQHNRRDIVLHSREGDLHVINDLHPAYAPLYYVLLFPTAKMDGIPH
jgi:hypothetical protein